MPAIFFPQHIKMHNISNETCLTVCHRESLGFHTLENHGADDSLRSTATVWKTVIEGQSPVFIQPALAGPALGQPH